MGMWCSPRRVGLLLLVATPSSSELWHARKVKQLIEADLGGRLKFDVYDHHRDPRMKLGPELGSASKSILEDTVLGKDFTSPTCTRPGNRLKHGETGRGSAFPRFHLERSLP